MKYIDILLHPAIKVKIAYAFFNKLDIHIHVNIQTFLTNKTAVSACTKSPRLIQYTFHTSPVYKYKHKTTIYMYFQ